MWLVFLIVAILMIPPLAFRWGLERIAERRLEEAIPYYERGDGFLRKGEYNQAIVEFSTAIGIDRDNVEAYFTRGNAYMLKGEYDLAVADFDTAISIAPNLLNFAYRRMMRRGNEKYGFAEAYERRDSAYHAKGEYNLAIADFTFGLRLRTTDLSNDINPYFANSVYQKRGQAYEAKGEYELAAADFEAAKRIILRDSD